jgi:hypothetical protein
MPVSAECLVAAGQNGCQEDQDGLRCRRADSASRVNDGPETAGDKRGPW